MSEKDRAESMLQEYIDLGLSKVKAKEACLIAIRVAHNLAILNAHSGTAAYLNGVKKEIKQL